MRTYSKALISEAINFIRQSTDFNIESWLANNQNIVLINDNNDLALFESDKPGIVIGHYYFKSRGKCALESAKQLLAEIFDPCYNIQVIKGITALDHLGARWLSRRIGFKSYGVIHVQGRAAELFILTREEYENK